MPVPEQDEYHWHVLYKDGTEFPEFEDAEPGAVARGWAEVQAESREVDHLFLMREGQVVALSQIPAGATPRFFRRRTRRMTLDGETESGHTVHCVGWEVGEQGVYLFVFDDGSCLLTTDLQAV